MMKRFATLLLPLLILALLIPLATCGDDDDDDDDSNGPLLDDDDDDDDNVDDDIVDDDSVDDDDTGDDDTGDDDTSDDDTGDDDTGDDDTGDDDTGDDDTGDDDTTAPEIDWCNIQHPYETVTAEGVASEMIFGRVNISGQTGSGSPLPYLDLEIGYGPYATNPSTNPGSYTWTAMTYNAMHTGDENDEYMKALTIADADTYAYAVRASADGKAWTYCDVDEGTTNGFSVADMGRIYVYNDDIDWCDLQWPASTTTTTGDPTETIYGQVYIPGVTGLGSPAATLRAHIGYGPTDKDPRTRPDVFVWLAATFNRSAGADDEFMRTLTVNVAGSYHYLYRYSNDSGSSWTYGDFDPGTGNGFSLDDLGDLTVTSR